MLIDRIRSLPPLHPLRLGRAMLRTWQEVLCFEAWGSRSHFQRIVRENRHKVATLVLCPGPALNDEVFRAIAPHRDRLILVGVNLACAKPTHGIHFDCTVSADPAVTPHLLSHREISGPLISSAFHQRKAVDVFLPMLRGELPQANALFGLGWGMSTSCALQVAATFGQKSIGIVGMNHSFTTSTRFGAPKERTFDAQQARADYGDVRLPAGYKVIIPNMLSIEHSLTAAKTALEAAAFEILDLTEGGLCPVFERGELGTWLNRHASPRRDWAPSDALQESPSTSR